MSSVAMVNINSTHGECSVIMVNVICYHGECHLLPWWILTAPTVNVNGYQGECHLLPWWMSFAAMVNIYVMFCCMPVSPLTAPCQLVSDWSVTRQWRFSSWMIPGWCLSQWSLGVNLQSCQKTDVGTRVPVTSEPISPARQAVKYKHS